MCKMNRIVKLLEINKHVTTLHTRHGVRTENRIPQTNFGRIPEIDFLSPTRINIIKNKQVNAQYIKATLGLCYVYNLTLITIREFGRFPENCFREIGLLCT